MTLSNTYSWSPVGQRVYVPYEAPQGRRVNAVGALSYGWRGGRRWRRFAFATLARAPKAKRKPLSPLAEGLEVSEVGVLDAEFLIGFIWKVAGRPEATEKSEVGCWRRERPLIIVLDNYSVHVGKRFQEERERWGAADIHLFFLPSYSPELSGIEPVWRDVKQHRMRRLSQSRLCDLKQAVDAALEEKARDLAETANSLDETA